MSFPWALGTAARLINAVLTSLSPLLASPAVRPVPEFSASSIAITRVTVIDVLNGAHRANVSLLIRDGRINAIAPAITIPPNATRLDGKTNS